MNIYINIKKAWLRFKEVLQLLRLRSWNYGIDCLDLLRTLWATFKKSCFSLVEDNVAPVTIKRILEMKFFVIEIAEWISMHWLYHAFILLIQLFFLIYGLYYIQHLSFLQNLRLSLYIIPTIVIILFDILQNEKFIFSYMIANHFAKKNKSDPVLVRKTFQMAFKSASNLYRIALLNYTLFCFWSGLLIFIISLFLP